MTRPVCEGCGTRETRRNVRLRPANDGCFGVHDPLWCDRCEALQLCQHPQQVEALLAAHQRILDAYTTLWVRHGRLRTLIHQAAHEQDDRADLPTPHELRTGQTRQDVLAGYTAVRSHQHATPAAPAAPGRVHIEGTPIQQHAFHTALATTPPRHPKEPPRP